MDLHRAGSKPDWENVPAAARNSWQRLAAATGGVVTIGNFFSVVGLISVPLGLWWALHFHQGWLGALLLAAGRACDLLDGWLAAKTGTKSPLGELLDATFDKISVFVTVVVLLIAGQIPVWMVVVLVLPHICVAGVAMMAYFRRSRLHVSHTGKISMALGWLFLLVWIASISTGSAHLSDAVDRMLATAGVLTLCLSVVTGLVSLVGYIRDFSGQVPSAAK